MLGRGLDLQAGQQAVAHRGQLAAQSFELIKG
ncbi:unnamed protein product, partial [Mycolicibacterium novocastrense]